MVTATGLFTFDHRTGLMVQAFFEERIFPGHERSAFQLSEQEEQEQAQEPDQDAKFFQTRDGKAHPETVMFGSRSVFAAMCIAAVSGFTVRGRSR